MNVLSFPLIEGIQIVVLLLVLFLATGPLGRFIAAVFAGEATFLSPILLPLERAIYAFCGVHSDEEMDWKEYAKNALIFSALGAVVLFLIFSLRHLLS